MNTLFAALINITVSLVSALKLVEGTETFQCQYYLASSTIPGAGFGLFTVNDVSQGNNLLPYADAPSINICESKDTIDESKWNLPNYVWGPVSMSGSECTQGTVSVSTFGSLCNYHTALMNVSPTEEKYDDTLADRYTDPGAGAFSYNGGHTFYTTRDIIAGEEIFADYGENWLETRDRSHDFVKYVPRWKDFEDAGKVLTKIVEGLGTEVTEGVLKTIKSIVNETFGERRTGALIPETVEEYKKIINTDSGEMINPRGAAMSIATKLTPKRSVEWIKQNGFCVETLRPGKSTISGAGRGAYAQTSFSKGSMILPMPLVAISDRSAMNIAEVELGSDRKELFLNYCFGHKNSPLLLHPQTNGFLANHCSARNPRGGHCGKLGGPNAKIQWGDSWDPDTPQWLNMTYDEIKQGIAARSRGLSFELVAIKDIHPGEEVFIDYGIGWEIAWDAHEKNWNPPINDGKYTPIRTMINKKDHRTLEELESNPYPTNVKQMCCFWDSEWETIGEEEIENNQFDGGEHFARDGHELAGVQPCELTERESNGIYSVRVFRSAELAPVQFYNYSEECISFRMVEGTADAFQKGVFRHYIEIDDTIFPEQWKVESDDNIQANHNIHDDDDDDDDDEWDDDDYYDDEEELSDVDGATSTEKGEL